VRGTLHTFRLAESPPHPDRKSDIAEASLRRSFLGRPPKAAYASPRKRGEVIRALAPIQLKAIMLYTGVRNFL
jgi:hypothetical protein